MNTDSLSFECACGAATCRGGLDLAYNRKEEKFVITCYNDVSVVLSLENARGVKNFIDNWLYLSKMKVKNDDQTMMMM